jgi:hypothetical protein
VQSVIAECTFVVAGGAASTIARSAVDRLASPWLSVCIGPPLPSAFAPVQSAATNAVARFPLAPVGFSASTPAALALCLYALGASSGLDSANSSEFELVGNRL